MKIRYCFLTILALCFTLASCHTTCKCTADQPSLGNLKKWQGYLKVKTADPKEPIATTQTQISNVSPSMAAAKIAQALESYDSKLDYRLSTVFQVANTDKGEGEQGGPAITDVVVEGHYYYVAMLDYPADEDNLAAYEQTKKQIPAIAVVDAEDETKPAWIRTADAKGNPYKIKLYLGVQAVMDDDNIYRFLRSKGYRTYGYHRLDNPTLELDDDWRPYFTATYCDNDSNAVEVGEAYYPEELLVVDAQTKELKAYKLDDPNTYDTDERAKDIPDWVDQIYSPELILDWIGYWGYNVSNYGKTSDLNHFIVDGNVIDQVMNAKNTNLVFVAYITSVLPDNSMIGVMLVDPRTGEATFYPTQGSDRAMATKSTALNAIRQATFRWQYEVEDLTLHTIYGVPTWEGVLTKPAFKNYTHDATSDESVSTNGKTSHERYGSLYAGTVLLRADYDVKPGKVVWARTKHEAFSLYEEHLVISRTTRVGSNVLEEKEVKDKVASVQTVVISGNTSYLIRLEGEPKKLFEVKIQYVGDPNTEEVLNLSAGDSVHLRYADPKNRKTCIVRELHLLEKAEPVKTSTDTNPPDADSKSDKKK